MSSWWPRLNLVYRAPLSGDVTQDISQSLQIAGDWDTELDVYKNVGSPGRQLGRLTDAVLELEARLRQFSDELAEQGLCEKSTGAHTDAFDALTEIASKVDEIKKSHRQRLKDQAKNSIERLQKANPDEFKALLRELNASNRANL